MCLKGCAVYFGQATAVRALFCSGGTGVFFLGSWLEVAGMTVRIRTILLGVCGVGSLPYLLFVVVMTSTHDLPVTAFGGSDAGKFAFCTQLAYGSLNGTV